MAYYYSNGNFGGVIGDSLCFALKGSKNDSNSPASSAADALSQDFFESVNTDSQYTEAQSSQGFDTGSTPSKNSSNNQVSTGSGIISSSDIGGSSSSDNADSSWTGSGSSTQTPSQSPTSSAASTTASSNTESIKDKDTGNQTSDVPVASDTPDTPDTNGAVYEYRASQSGNTIVITKIAQPSVDGVYDIPETIDGKTVVAIMENVFSDENIRDTVKTVIIPACVKQIKGVAFYYCYNMTELYIKGDYIYFPESGLFAPESLRTGTLTIYASANCEDKTSFYKVKRLAEFNGAVFVEWNG